MKITIYKRDFSAELAELPLDYQVERYSFAALGGPHQAVVPAAGDELDLWSLIERVRAPVRIFSDYGDAVWWGFLAEVQLSIGGWSVGVSVDTMRNAIRMAFEDQENSNIPTLTGWAEDAQSIAEYGRRELILTTNGSTLAHAQAARDAALARMRYPIPVIRPNPGGTGKQGTLYCRGWKDTLAWKYYAQPAGVEEYVPSQAGGEYPVGATSGSVRLGQGFQISIAWTLKTLAVRAKAVETPADNLVLSIFSDSSGQPGSSLGSASVAGASIGTELDWVTATLATPLALSASTPYWIVVSRSGSVDPANYYLIEVSLEAGYASGTFMVDGGAWAGPDPSPDMSFRLLSTEDTAIQAAAIATAGEFIATVDRDVSSGILTNQYRDGYAAASYEFEELLKMGTNNSKRMLYTIDVHRRLRIFEEPGSAQPHLLQKDGSLRDYGDRAVRNETCPAGIWTRLKEVIPPSVDTTLLADPALMFVEQQEYETAMDRLTPTPRGADDPFDLGTVQDG